MPTLREVEYALDSYPDTDGVAVVDVGDDYRLLASRDADENGAAVLVLMNVPDGFAS